MTATTKPRTRTQKPTYLSEDILVERMTREEKSDRVILTTQVIRGDIITRIAESIEYPKATVVWIEGEEYPMTVDCEIREFHNAWVTARKNIHINQQL